MIVTPAGLKVGMWLIVNSLDELNVLCTSFILILAQDYLSGFFYYVSAGMTCQTSRPAKPKMATPLFVASVALRCTIMHVGTNS